MMQSRKSMATAAPTIISGSHILGGPVSSSTSSALHVSGTNGEGLGGSGQEQSFFEMEKARLVEDISGAFEELMSSTNVLNRKLEEVFGVGKEFETVAGLWGKFNTLIREQNIDPNPNPSQNTNSPNSHNPLTSSSNSANDFLSSTPNPRYQNQYRDDGGKGEEEGLRKSVGVPGTGGRNFGA